MDNTLKTRMIPSFRVAIHYALIALFAYYGAYYLTSLIHTTSRYAPIGALWATIVGITVAQHTGRETAIKAKTQILGGLLGAVTSYIYLLVLPANPPGMVLLIGCVVLICQVMGWPDYSVSAGLTVAVILFFSQIYPELVPLTNVSIRFAEVVIGSVIAVLVVQFFSFTEKTAG
jgi:uncharacterized membrane protein YccC